MINSVSVDCHPKKACQQSVVQDNCDDAARN